MTLLLPRLKDQYDGCLLCGKSWRFIRGSACTCKTIVSCDESALERFVFPFDAVITRFSPATALITFERAKHKDTKQKSKTRHHTVELSASITQAVTRGLRPALRRPHDAAHPPPKTVTDAATLYPDERDGQIGTPRPVEDRPGVDLTQDTVTQTTET